VRVLQLIRALGGHAKNLYLIGCEPARLDGEGVIGLSEEVRNAIPLAAEMIERVLADFSTAAESKKIFQTIRKATCETFEMSGNSRCTLHSPYTFSFHGKHAAQLGIGL
jgi:Ni,Fe-hydrogenase maturation factor